MAKRLEEIREEKGLSIREVLRRARMSSRAYYNIARGGKRSPRIETMRKIADAMEVDIMDVQEFVDALGENRFIEFDYEPPSPEEWMNTLRQMLRNAMENVPEGIVDLEYRAYKNRQRERRGGKAE